MMRRAYFWFTNQQHYHQAGTIASPRVFYHRFTVKRIVWFKLWSWKQVFISIFLVQVKFHYIAKQI